MTAPRAGGAIRDLLHELTQGDGMYYLTQEAAFAPGISGEWPDVIQRLGTPKHKARLVKRQMDPAALTALLAAHAEAEAERERLAAFARKVIEAHWDGGDVDSSDVDDWATAEGLLIPVQVTEPCVEGCRCEEYDNIPGTCYRFAPVFGVSPSSAPPTGEGS